MEKRISLVTWWPKRTSQLNSWSRGSKNVTELSFSLFPGHSFPFQLHDQTPLMARWLWGAQISHSRLVEKKVCLLEGHTKAFLSLSDPDWAMCLSFNWHGQGNVMHWLVSPVSNAFCSQRWCQFHLTFADCGWEGVISYRKIFVRIIQRRKNGCYMDIFYQK